MCLLLPDLLLHQFDGFLFTCGLANIIEQVRKLLNLCLVLNGLFLIPLDFLFEAFKLVLVLHRLLLDFEGLFLNDVESVFYGASLVLLL